MTLRKVVRLALRALRAAANAAVMLVRIAALLATRSANCVRRQLIVVLGGRVEPLEGLFNAPGKGR